MFRIHVFKIGRAVRWQGDPFAFHRTTRNGTRRADVFVVGPVALVTVTGR